MRPTVSASLGRSNASRYPRAGVPGATLFACPERRGLRPPRPSEFIMEPNQQIITWLRDAHALEQSLENILQTHIAEAREMPEMRERLQQHLEETREHRARVASALSTLGESPSKIKSMTGGFMGMMQGLSTAVFQDRLIKNVLADYAIGIRGYQTPLPRRRTPLFALWCHRVQLSINSWPSRGKDILPARPGGVRRNYVSRGRFRHLPFQLPLGLNPHVQITPLRAATILPDCVRERGDLLTRYRAKVGRRIGTVAATHRTPM